MAKAQVEPADKEFKANTSKIEAVKKKKGTSVDKMEIMNAKLEEAKRKAHALYVRVVG